MKRTAKRHLLTASAVLVLFLFSGACLQTAPSLPTAVEGPVYGTKDLDVKPLKLYLTRNDTRLPPSQLKINRVSYYEPIWTTNGCVALASVLQVRTVEVLSGEAEMEYVIDENGYVAAIHILKATHPEVAAKIYKCIANWCFTPGEKDGKQVKVRLRQVYKYGK